MKKTMFFTFVLLIGSGLLLPVAFTEANLPVSLESDFPVRELAFSPDGAILASGHGKSTLETYVTSTGNCIFYITLFTTLYSGETRFWDMRSGNQNSELVGGSGYIYGLDFSPDGATFVRAGFANRLYRICHLWEPAMYDVESTRFLQLRNTDTRQTVSTLTGHSGSVYAVAFSPDGSILASGSDDDTIRLWNAATGASLNTLTGHSGDVNTVAFSPDSSVLASGSDDGTIRLWNAVTSAPLNMLTGHSGDVNAVAFSPDGSVLASGSDDDTIRLWNAVTGASLNTLTGHSGDVNAVAFSPDGSILASGSDDDTIRLWNAATGAPLDTLTGHSGDVNAVAFSPDGITLASGASDGRILLWSLLSNYRLIASSKSPLTEATLDGGVVSLTLTGHTYERNLSRIRNAVTVSGINGVTVNTATAQRISNTEITIGLNFNGTDFDTGARLTFSLNAGAIAGYTGDAFTAGIPVTAVKESVAASVVSPLTDATLDGGVVSLTLTGLTYEQNLSRIRNAVTVSGITGVTVNTAKVQRVSDTEITVELNFDGTDFDTEGTLTFNVASGAIAGYTGDAFTVEIPVTSAIDASRVKIYWTDWRTEKIQRANLDGSNVQDLVTQGLDASGGIALDVAGGKMYWTDFGTNKIQRANLDGSNVEDLVTQGLETPGGIALDVAGGRMYWTEAGTSKRGTQKIQRANLDGSNVEDLVTTGLETPDGIALDVAGGKMYWTDSWTGKIQRANLDGSNVEDLVTQGLETPGGIALDVAGGKMYWTDRGTQKIQRANLDGSNVEDLVTTGLETPDGIALDVAGGKMYWTDRAQKIHRANLDGSKVEDLVTTGLRWPGHIAISIPTSVPPIAREDVNRDRVVDVQDIIYVAQRYGQTGQNRADVNGDGVVNIDDIVLVAAVVDSAPAAPSVRSQLPKDLTAATVTQWLTEAKLTGNKTPTYQRGIFTLEQLLAALTPKETALLPNYPNPFNPETWIPYHLSTDADVTLSIYDTNGALIRELDLGHQQAGFYTDRTEAAYWDGRNDVGEQVASGVYFYQLQAGSESFLRKMVILK